VTAPLSNFLADLAEQAGSAYRRGRARSVEAATDYLASARLLAEARDACRGSRGAWGAFLDRAGIPARTARRMMQLAASGIDAETLADLGIRGAAEAMARDTKTATVAVLEPEPHPSSGDENRDNARAPSLYQRRRAAGLCVECGEPSDGSTRCPKHAARVAERDRQRRALAGVGRKIAPRVTAAASAGHGMRLSAAEAAELAAMIALREDTP